MIDEVKYVREDSIKSTKPDISTDGLKYAIVRSRYQGVMTGYVKSIEGQIVVLIKARQIWRYDCKFVLVDMAEYGVRDASKCKFSCASSNEVVMLEACGVIYCTEAAGNSIRSVKATEK